MAKLNSKVIAALSAIAASGRVSKEVGEPLLKQNLITVNMDDIVEGMAAAKLTDAALASMPKQAATSGEGQAAPSFALISGIVLPESKRGAGRQAGPAKYPFETMGKDVSFFVSDTEAGDKGALKKLGSTVSNANNKYRTPTGESTEVIRTVRGEGNKAVLNADGTKKKETKQVPVYKQDKKFTIRGVVAGTKYGDWVAPENGAVIQRIL